MGAYATAPRSSTAGKTVGESVKVATYLVILFFNLKVMNLDDRSVTRNKQSVKEQENEIK